MGPNERKMLEVLADRKRSARLLKVSVVPPSDLRAMWFVAYEGKAEQGLFRVGARGETAEEARDRAAMHVLHRLGEVEASE